MRELSLYLHIPFCARKCRYCDFLSYPAAEREQEEYLALLLKEIEEQSFFYKKYRVISIFIGGGTPSLLEGDAVKRIFEELNRDYTIEKDCEITLEANPDSLAPPKLAAYRQAGVNRLSVGLQSADDEELRRLGRIHDYRTFCRAYEAARREGFQNINIDLMSAVPGQTSASYRKTLERVLSLKPEHISAYSLILEEGTWFYEHRKELSFPTEDEDRELYELTGEMLALFNYIRYEISNYAKAGYECRHNKVYWKRGNYAGFGLGAASMVNDVRWSNRRTMREYREALSAADPGNLKEAVALQETGALREAQELIEARARFGENVQYLSRQEQMEEFMFLGLRLTEGVRKRDFLDRFGVPIEDVYGGTLDRLRREGLLRVDDAVRLTPYGFDISNYVMAKFLF
ncbi:MAG: radical SAM family heme chaperone HemW [Blautia sp.]|nr:radical SAM family heme chaperone HemW [Blautia sp.]MCM1201748.1 radical SAM family heme chaperone HemW [Bacteroides fragilis]